MFEIEFLDPARACSEIRDQSYDLFRANNGAGVVRDIDIESSVHVLIRVIRQCVLDHRDLVAELSGKANGRFDACMLNLAPNVAVPGCSASGARHCRGDPAASPVPFAL